MKNFIITNIENSISEKIYKNLKIDFTYLGFQNRKIRVKISEIFFNLGYSFVGGEINIKHNNGYWVSSQFDYGLSFRFNNKIKISFVDCETGETIENYVCSIVNDNNLRRSMGDNPFIKNVWILGDSNVYYYFNKYTIGSDDFKYNNMIINPIDVPELSINRFINSDYLGFLNMLPILPNDEIIIILGEIDCRVGFYRNSEHKKNNLIDQINSVVDRYVSSICDIKNRYKDTVIKISLPNPVIKDGWLSNKDDLTYKTNEKDRLFIRSYYEKYITEKLKEINIEYLNITEGFSNSLGFTKIEYLIKNDTHNVKTDIVRDNIIKHYNSKNL